MSVELVSVLCITYNHERYIGDCLQGFVSQITDFDVEILIFDDCSSDSNQFLITSFSDKYPNIKTFFQTENQWSQGKYGMIDWLLPAAKGKYIALCEGDDYWTDPYKLQKQVDFLEANPICVACFHDAVEIHEEDFVGNRFSGRSELSGKLLLNGQYPELYSSSRILRMNWFIPTASLVFRNILPKDLSIFDNCMSGDLALVGVLAGYGDFYFLNEPMSVYRKHANGVSITHYGDDEKDIRLFKNRFDMYVNLARFHHPKFLDSFQKQLSYYVVKLKALDEFDSHRNFIFWRFRLIRQIFKLYSFFGHRLSDILR